MTVNAILACDKNYGIGKDNGLPWPRNEYDMKWFRENTKGHIVLMGRKTWESLDNKKLSGRINCVLTHRVDNIEGDPDYVFSGDINKTIAFLKEKHPDKKIWIIGGANIYAQTIAHCDNIYLTQFKGSYDCDAFVDPVIFQNFIELAKVNKTTDCNFSIWGRA